MSSPIPAIDTSDRPFGLPPDIVLDIPVPPSVNITRRSHGLGVRRIEEWHRAADAALMTSGQYRGAKARRPRHTFELQIILDEQICRLDLDNPMKCAIDYLRRIELIVNDSPKHLRRLTIEWGVAPQGCRLILREAA